MQPSIKRSIGSGFPAAKKGWLGILVYALGSLLIGGVVMGAVFLTGVPEELQGGAQNDSAFTEEGFAADAAGVELLEQQQEAAADWLSRAWPVLLLVLLLAIGGGLLLNGGQIGFMGNMIQNDQAGIPEFVGAAKKSFKPLLGAWGLSLAAAVVMALALGLVSLLFAALSFLPGWLLGFLGFIVGVALFVGLVWVAVRLAFWFIAIVVDQMGPIVALKNSFEVTKGHTLKVLGLIVLMALISMAVGLVVQLLQAGASAIPGVGGFFGIVFGLVGLVANLFVGFALIGAFVRFYLDAKGEAQTSTPASV